MSTVATNAFVWNELLTRDAKSAQAFYTGLLGWSAREERMGPGAYYMFQAGGHDVGGLVPITGPEWQGVPAQWLPYIRVDDVDAAAARALALGGTIRIPPTSEPGVGRFCLIADPTGAPVALIAFERSAAVDR